MRISDWSSDVCSSDLIGAVGNHGDHEVVRHEVAGIHDRLRLAAELAARGSGSAQHIASRELDQIVPLFQALGLSSLARARRSQQNRSEEHTSELQSLMRISYAVFCLKKKKNHD